MDKKSLARVVVVRVAVVLYVPVPGTGTRYGTIALLTLATTS